MPSRAVVAALTFSMVASGFLHAASTTPASGTKNLFVMLDGTGNTETSATNIARLHEYLSAEGESVRTLYISGVGTKCHTLICRITGEGLGHGMEDNILDAYAFLGENYQPGDRIFIFGFSRGAHEARALAGLIAYARILPGEAGQKDLRRDGNRVLELVKTKNDRDFLSQWSSWQPANGPILGDDIRSTLGIRMRPAEVEFLGVWDTVPGSSLKKFDTCRERRDGKDGDRYKSDSYPSIRHIVHAVSIDEKRSKFAPLLVCPAIDPARTTVEERWFPGAHADVGGGYGDHALPNLSLRWMLDKLSGHYQFAVPPALPKDNPSGLAHWSIGDKRANAGSKCIDRTPGSDISPAVADRANAGLVPIRVLGEERKLKYPLKCKSPTNKKEPIPANEGATS